MLSTLARRTILTKMSPLSFTPSITVPAAAAFSTATHSQAGVLEDLLKNMRWSDIKDNVHAIDCLMEENKTNHAVKVPDAEFERHVSETMRDIQNMLVNDPKPDRNSINARVVDLKMKMKHELYGC